MTLGQALVLAWLLAPPAIAAWLAGRLFRRLVPPPRRKTTRAALTAVRSGLRDDDGPPR